MARVHTVIVESTPARLILERIPSNPQSRIGFPPTQQGETTMAKTFIRVEIFPKVSEIERLSPSVFEDWYHVSGKIFDDSRFHGFASNKELADVLFPTES